MRGWVYIVTNPSLEGLVKIGYSSKDPVLRVEDFNNAGLPHPHCLQYDVLVNDPYSVEQAAHKALRLKHHSKEWFKCTVEEAINAVKGCVNGNIVNESFHIKRPLGGGDEHWAVTNKNSAFMNPMIPSPALAKIVGDQPIPRTEVTKLVWSYVKKHKLQDSRNRRLINADATLKEVIGKPSVSMFEITKLLGKHLK
jgi:chromatin remodeling complex protein RSC6